jgi:hypothetical protein
VRSGAANAQTDVPTPVTLTSVTWHQSRWAPSASEYDRVTVARRSPLRPFKPGEPVLLSGGNPRIRKGDGDAPVQAYIAAMPGWKHDLGRRLDQLIERAVPDVTKAVRWNSPFCGLEGRGWFLNYHCFTHYVKVAFFQGACWIRCHPASPRTSTRGTSTSTSTNSTRSSSKSGSSRPVGCPAGARDERLDASLADCGLRPGSSSTGRQSRSRARSGDGQEVIRPAGSLRRGLHGR